LVIAVHWYRGGQYARASPYFKTYLEGPRRHPNSEAVRLTYAISLAGEGKTQIAEATLLQLTQQATMSRVRGLAHMMLARQYLSVQDYEKARFHYGAVMEHYEGTVEALKEVRRILPALDIWLERSRRDAGR
jgi:hypothetical protein